MSVVKSTSHRVYTEQFEKLKWLSWNVHDLTSVYNNNDFLNLVDSYDILFLSETWLNDSNLIDIDGFVKISCQKIC